VLRTLKESLRSRIRQLWEQCDLFDQLEAAQPRSRPVERPVMHPAQPVRPTFEPTRIAMPPSAMGGTGLLDLPDVRTTRVRTPRTNPQDVALVAKLTAAHQYYNAKLFNGALRTVPIRISRRMKNRLGHYMAALPSEGIHPEIAISRRHIRRDPWDDVLHTLVHEMVHQWQDENGLPLDHGQYFRRKAREIGISARATRPAAPRNS